MSEEPSATHRVIEPSVLYPGVPGEAPVEPPAEVSRWEDFGGTWVISAVDELAATVELRRCDGGEIASTLTLSDPRELRWAHEQRAIETGENGS